MVTSTLNYNYKDTNNYFYVVEQEIKKKKLPYLHRCEYFFLYLISFLVSFESLSLQVIFLEKKKEKLIFN